MASVTVRRRPLWKRILRAPKLFVQVYRIGHRLDTVSRIRFAAWQAWHSLRTF